MRIRNLVFFTLFSLLFLSAQLFADLGPNHKKRVARPIKLGSSGGNVLDFSVQGTQEFCCSGTLGAVVADSTGKKFILSNNHVMGKINTAKVGDQISQPGNIDKNCSPTQNDIVATFTKFVKINFGANTNNKVDASIAAVLPNMVSANGAILDVGAPGGPVNAAVGMRCKKSGRTTGTRKGVVEALNIISRVLYPTKCGKNTTKIARFTDQILIVDAPGGTAAPFSAGGDSGSLIVQDQGTCPGTVGLLFAGDDAGNTIANRIQNVLSALGNGMHMVGCTAAAAGEREAEADSGISLEHPEMIRAMAIQNQMEERLVKIEGVNGVGIGMARPGSRQLAIVVLVTRGSIAANSASAVPSTANGMPVRKIITGEFKAF
jgi:hypothetical protein